MKKCSFLLLSLTIFLLSCKEQDTEPDAYGNFEAIEVIVSAETQGRILDFKAKEGSQLEKDQVSVRIDTTQLFLKKAQLESGRASLRSREKTLDAQIRANHVQMNNLKREKERMEQLVAGGAATSKQLDDLKGQIDLLDAQIAATESQKTSLHAEGQTLEVQILQVEDQLEKSAIRNPLDGILLTKYKQEGEMIVPGGALYKMANLDELILRAYVSGKQLSSVKVGEEVSVFFDQEDGLKETRGLVSWVSSQAEFTPKIIQTREERVNLVYAVKVLVANDGSLKIGMPGEIKF